MKPIKESPANPSVSVTENKHPSGSMEALLDEYAESHQHPVNKRIHFLCVPAIFWSILALLWTVEAPLVFNLAIPAAILVTIYYLWKSPRLAVPLVVFMILCGVLNILIQRAGWPLWAIALGVFIIAWIGQFIGHAIEGKKPSFFKDLQFLLVGPAWIANHWLNKKTR